MATKRKPKLMAGLLVGGIVVLGGGAAVAAMLTPSDVPTPAALVASAPSSAGSTPSALPTTAPPAAPSPTPTPAPPAAAASAPAVANLAPAAQAVTYVVKRGDTLSGIAAWFKLHGYEDLYAANRAAIGSDPDLIRPGERISIVNGAMSFEPPR